MIITVPLIPPSPNELRRKYRSPYAYKKLRELWEHNLFYSGSCARHRNELIEFAKKPTVISVQVTIHHSREFDADNLVGALKPILDALRNIGFIKDDDAKHLRLEAPRQVLAKEKKTVICIHPYTPLTV